MNQKMHAFSCQTSQPLPCSHPNLPMPVTGRKLLQPFTLGLKEGGRRSGNVGNTGERRTNGLSFTTAGLVDSECWLAGSAGVSCTH
jgi:hypothetical protein